MNDNAPTIDRLIPLREAMLLAGMRVTKTYAEIAAGRLAVVRNGRRTFVRATELQRYIDALEGSMGDTRHAA